MIIYPVNHKARHTIGGKARGLVQLREAGVNVPDFLVLATDTFTHLINKKEEPDVLYSRLSGFTLSPQDEAVLKQILAQWNFPGQSVIVRSSIADEDGGKDAFAGVMQSFSNILNYQDLIRAIASCAASACSARAIAYRRYKGLGMSSRIAVIIQKQISADVSGVVFTTNPQYPQELAIHAVPGLGQALADGLSDADEFYFFKSNSQCHRNKIARKEECIMADENSGTKKMAVPLHLQQTACLANQQALAVFTQSNQLEKIAGHPLDIEFALVNNTIYFLQARPITQKIAEIIVYDNSNIQESYCGVTTPLTFSFAQRAYATVYRQTMELLHLPKSIIEQHHSMLNNLLGLIKGRIYYNLVNWYRGLQLLPSFKQNKEDMERMMGVEEPVDFVTNKNLSLLYKIKLLPRLLFNLARLLREFKKLQKSVVLFKEEFKKTYEEYYSYPKENISPAALVKQKELLDVKLLQNWTIPIINDFFVMMMNGRVHRQLKGIGIEKPEEFISRYFAGNQNIVSVKPALLLQQLAENISRQPLLQNLILTAGNDIHEQVKKGFPDFYQEAQNYIELYGDRIAGELKLETITMRLQPELLYTYLKNYLQCETSFSNSTGLHTEAKKELEQKLKPRRDFFRKKIFRSLQNLQQAIQARESMRLERTRLFGMYRHLYMAAGELLQHEKKMLSARDIFYLSEEEIMLLLQQKDFDSKNIIAKRKEEFRKYEGEDLPARVTYPLIPMAQAATMPADDEKVLYGSGCVPGEITSEVVVITAPENAGDVQGKIICALRTDPGWVVLFPACKGVLIEKGSALSHSVILLREFGIPAIINIPGVTKKLRSGQRITMNGATGEIKKLE